MVKVLLEEQRALKDRLEMQDKRIKDGKNPGVQESIDINMMLVRKQREITKKASERTRS